MADECPVKHDKSSTSNTAAEMGCPVKDDGSTENYNPAANDLSYNQHRQPGQKLDMSTTRPVSGIPKSSFTPGHQFAGVDRWVYPSGMCLPFSSLLSYLLYFPLRRQYFDYHINGSAVFSPRDSGS
jgi:hypothetical protein